MHEHTYNVTLDNRVIACGLTLEYAIIFSKALFNEYYAEPNMKVSIERIGPDLNYMGE